MKKSARNEQALFGARGELPYLGSAPIPAAGDRRVAPRSKPSRGSAGFPGPSRRLARDPLQILSSLLLIDPVARL